MRSYVAYSTVGLFAASCCRFTILTGNISGGLGDGGTARHQRIARQAIGTGGLGAATRAAIGAAAQQFGAC